MLLHFFSGQILHELLSHLHSPVIPRASTAYNRINVVIRTSRQCNSLTSQSSRVFTPSCLYLFHFRNITVRAATLVSLREKIIMTDALRLAEP